MGIKIGVVGTHGTGKSYKALELSLQYKRDNPDKRVFLLQENVGNCPYPFNLESTVQSQMWILSDQLKHELEVVLHYNIVVCDRTVLDSIPYSLATGTPELVNYIEEVLPFVSVCMRSYDKIYLMDGEKHNYQINDGIREVTNVKFRENVNTEFFRLCNELYQSGHIRELEVL